jgi:chromosome segregation ATPase
MADDSGIFTYDELAARLGTTRAAARILAQRKVKAGRWSRMTGNDGKARVRVLLADLQGHGEAQQGAQTEARAGTVQEARPGTVPGAQDALIAELRARLDDRAEERDRALADLERTRTYLDHARAELETERTHARDLADRLDRLHRERLTDLERRRPWWLRLLRR